MPSCPTKGARHDRNEDSLFSRSIPGRLVIVCDFARFRVHRLTTDETFEFALKDLHKHIKHFGCVAGYKAQTI